MDEVTDSLPSFRSWCTGEWTPPMHVSEIIETQCMECREPVKIPAFWFVGFNKEWRPVKADGTADVPEHGCRKPVGG